MAIVNWASLVALVLLLQHLRIAAAVGTVVKKLPGFSGELPFTLETGYVSVGESEMFYYFIQSEGRPHIDPVILYFNGGPGCSGLNGLFYQTGPLAFNLKDYAGGLPQLYHYQYAWTKTASIIYLDAPVGAGFSYPTTVEDVNTSDSKFATEVHGFVRQWMIENPKFRETQFFIGTDSYAGLISPIVAEYILNDNTAGVQPYINLKGLILSAPHTQQELQENWRIPYAHRMTILSDSQYESLKTSCKGRYISNANTSYACEVALNPYNEALVSINMQFMLDPDCSMLTPKPDPDSEGSRRYMEELPRGPRHSSRLGGYWCRNFMYLLTTLWGQYKSVQDALHVREGTIPFFRCSISLLKDHYTYDVNSAIPYHKNLTKSGLQLIIFMGDHDMVIPHPAVEEWIKSLGVALDTDWRPWFVDGQVGGYIRKYAGEGYALTYATVKGAGHSPHEYKRREVDSLFQRWIHYYTA